MIELLKLPITLISEWVCFIASILIITKYHPTVWRMFQAYLFIVVCIETLSYFGLRFKYIHSTQWLYNLFMPIHGLFYFYVFSKIIRLKSTNTALILAASLFIGSMLAEGIYQGFSQYFFRSYIVLCILAIGFCIMYYYSLFRQVEYSDLLNEPAFWFTAGSLAYFAIGTSVTVFFVELLSLKVKNQIPLRGIIMSIVNVMMYGCWIKSFLCLQNKQDYTRPSYSPH